MIRGGYRAFPVLLSLLLVSAASAATQVTDRGITWKFAGNHTVGQFVDGSWWVVGPITITEILPKDSNLGDSNDYNGTHINPKPHALNGLDSSIQFPARSKYDRSKNAARQLPVQVANSSSVVSCISENASYPKELNRVCVLTVLASPPHADAFRPGIFGTDKTIRSKASDIQFSKLPRLAATSSSPSIDFVGTTLSGLPWFEWDENFAGQLFQPSDNLGPAENYGRSIAHIFGRVALTLCLDYSDAQKRDLLIKFVQVGIDVADFLENGGGFYHDGGHKHGRKIALVTAAHVLGSPAYLKKFCDTNVYTYFQEDQQTWIVSQDDVGRNVDEARGKVPYNVGHVGLPEWGIRHRNEPIHDDSRWEATYRTVVGPSSTTCYLAASLMGAEGLWAWPPGFAYYLGRFYTTHKANGGVGGDYFSGSNNIPGWTSEMYDAYYSGGAAPTRVSTPFINPAGGTAYYPDEINGIAVSVATQGATIWYTTDGSTPVANASLRYDPATKINLGSSITKKKVTVKAIAVAPNLDPSAVNSADFHFEPQGTGPISRTGWTIADVSSEEVVDAANGAINILDGDTKTFWHTKYVPSKVAPPHHVTIDMGARYDIVSLSYTPRGDSANGRLGSYSWFLSDSLTDFGSAIASGNYDGTTATVTLPLEPTRSGRYLKFVCGGDMNGENFATVAELSANGGVSEDQTGSGGNGGGNQGPGKPVPPDGIIVSPPNP